MAPSDRAHGEGPQAGKRLYLVWDIGSGPTEAFCGTLTAHLKGSGMRWDRPNAESVMALAALEHSHQWQQYWAAQRLRAA